MSRTDLPSFEQFAAQAREHGFDAVGVLPLEMRNDGGEVSLPTIPGFPIAGENYYYDTMITRIVSLYEGRFQTR